MSAPRTPPTTLVTGGCGFIGFSLCRRLGAAGHQVVAYDDLSRGRAENLPAQADAALYVAKRTGRNRVEAAGRVGAG